MYNQVFEPGIVNNSKCFRIPAILTLNDGSVLTASDIRYDHGSDSPNNIDTAVAISPNGYNDWQYSVINHFDDYANGVTDKNSSSFIDSAIGQSIKTNRIFIVTDAYGSGGGILNTKKGSGYAKESYDGFSGDYLLLAKKGTNKFDYFAGEFEKGYAPVISRADHSKTGYTVDSEYNLYLNGKPLLTKQVGSDKNIQQSVFFSSSDLVCLGTMYLWLRYSDDNGKSWSIPHILNPMVKTDDESFLGVAPGRMTTINYNGNERIIFMAYKRNSVGKEDVVSIYSDDNGVTWKRGEFVKHSFAVGKTSESQIVELNNNTLRMFCRNIGDYIAYCDSTDGGVTWTKAHYDENLPAMGNCMTSFINTSKTIDGKKIILGSYASNQLERADGVIRVGLVDADNTISWVENYHINDGFFAYSCLTELSDGNIGILYEDEPAHISYMVLSLDEKGKLTEINNNNINFVKKEQTGFKVFAKSLKNKLQKLLNLY